MVLHQCGEKVLLGYKYPFDYGYKVSVNTEEKFQVDSVLTAMIFWSLYHLTYDSEADLRISSPK